MKVAFISILLFLSFHLYSQNSEPGSKEAEDKPTVLLRGFGDSEDNIFPGDSTSLQIVAYSSLDSVIYEGILNFEVREEANKIDFSSLLAGLHLGDSVSVLLKDPANFDFSGMEHIFLKSRDMDVNRMEIKVARVKGSEELIAQRQWMEILEKDLFQKERDDIDFYLHSNNLSIFPEPNGIYLSIEEKGKGPGILTGSAIRIRYTGKFLNGEVFDSAFSGEKTMNFNYGNQFYLVEGLNYAIGRMRQGDKAWVLIPSRLAFGESGSAGGIVPPNTPVVYEVEIINVQ